MIDYQYVAPKTDAKTKTTTLNHNITVKIDAATLEQIASKVSAIRENIIK